MPLHMIPQVAHAMVRAATAGRLTLYTKTRTETTNFDHADYVTCGRYTICAFCLTTLAPHANVKTIQDSHACSRQPNEAIRSLVEVSDKAQIALVGSRTVDYHELDVKAGFVAPTADETVAPSKDIVELPFRTCDLDDSSATACVRNHCQAGHDGVTHLPILSGDFKLPNEHPTKPLDDTHPHDRVLTRCPKTGLLLVHDTHAHATAVVATAATRAILMHDLLTSANVDDGHQARSACYGPTFSNLTFACHSTCASDMAHFDCGQIVGLDLHVEPSD
ncbi:outer capsid VP7 [Grass carp reovirus]|uniref:Outer capsid VP7 n=1 Tax=Grass carp reovirus TaxID=128987 RepID=A0A172T0P7_GCRV|nr:outer capsid VP7 [Grass carp reovirus]